MKNQLATSVFIVKNHSNNRGLEPVYKVYFSEFHYKCTMQKVSILW